MSRREHLVFGGRKYAAFNLMLARWLARPASERQNIQYVTMGGTELFDVANVCWVGSGMVKSATSFEAGRERFKVASKTAELYNKNGYNVEVLEGDYFGYERTSDNPHLFYVDLEGIFSSQYVKPLKDWFSSQTLTCGDVFLVTSYQGRNPGWSKVFTTFTGEYRFLGVSDESSKKSLYYEAHPCFVLYRALEEAGFENELELVPLGHIRYMDTSPMGLYGFLCLEGSTDFRRLISDMKTFDTVRRLTINI